MLCLVAQNARPRPRTQRLELQGEIHVEHEVEPTRPPAMHMLSPSPSRFVRAICAVAAAIADACCGVYALA